MGSDYGPYAHYFVHSHIARPYYNRTAINNSETKNFDYTSTRNDHSHNEFSLPGLQVIARNSSEIKTHIFFLIKE